MEEQIYTFSKGEYSQVPEEYQPKDTYRSATNFIRTDSGQLSAEYGTTVLSVLPTGLERLAHYNLNGELILFLVNSTSTISEIGILSKSNIYTPIISNRGSSGATLQLTTNVLAFSRSSMLDVEARKLFDGDRVIYFVDGVNVDRRINLDDLPTVMGFDTETQLQFSFNTPKIDLVSVTDDGALPSGVYQLAIRYLTSGGNSTSTGIITNPISVVDESQNSGRDNVDGAPPQTSTTKAINIELKNIDPNYPFIEIIAITFIGVANTPQFSIIGRIDNTGGIISFTYSDTSQIIGSLTLEEITIQPTIYTKSKHISQKDGILFRSNLVTDSIDLEFQSIANAIQIDYFIEELAYDESINIKVGEDDWTNTGPISGNNWNPQEITADRGSTINSFFDYKNETIASTKAGFMRQEIYSLALVPLFKSGVRGFAYHIPGQSTVSENANAVTKKVGTYISTEQYPVGRGYPTGSIRHHRMPTIEQEPIFINNSGQISIRTLGLKLKNIIVPSNLKDQIEGFLIVRQKRDINSNRTIVASGVGKRFYQLDDFVAMIPSYGKMVLQDLFLDEAIVSTSRLDPNLFGFFAPDILHGIRQNYSFTHIERVNSLSGVREFDTRGRSQLREAYNFCNFNTISSASSLETSLVGTVREIPAFDAINEDDGQRGFALPFGQVTSYLSRRSNGHTVFSTQGNAPPIDFFEEEKYDYGPSEDEEYRVNTDTPTIELLTLKNLIDNVYGRIENARYVKCDEVIYSIPRTAIDGGVLPDTEAEMYGGDTFISKYGLLMADAPGSDKDRLTEAQSLCYFFVETVGNYNFRHFIDESIGEDTGSLPYYPKYNILYAPASPIGIFNYGYELGHSIGYNKQYSKENDLIDFIPKPLLFTEQLEFPNRTIRSEKTFEGEIGDNYRIFLPNNFQDITKSKGEITNTFVWNGEFYIHTERGLFRAFVNTREQIITDVSQVVIGTGEVFSQPPIELFDQEGGYLGSISKLVTTITPYGCYFIVNSRGKVFVLTNTIKEISDLGLYNFFESNINEDQTSPLENLGYVAGFDYLNKRWMLTKLGDQGFTKTFFVPLDSWTGSHTYKPNSYINRDKDTIICKAGLSNLYLHSSGDQGVFFDESKADSELELVFNLPLIPKVYDNLIIGARGRERSGLDDYRAFFKSIRINTIDQNSGEINLIISNDVNPVLTSSQIKVSYKRKQYRLSIPLDAVIDGAANNDIFDNSNLNFDKTYKGRIFGHYALCKFKYNSDIDKSILLSYIKLLFRPSLI